MGTCFQLLRHLVVGTGRISNIKVSTGIEVCDDGAIHQGGPSDLFNHESFRHPKHVMVQRHLSRMHPAGDDPTYGEYTKGHQGAPHRR